MTGLLDEPLEFKQNTIDDFYEDTMSMLQDLFNLSCTKLSDFLHDGKLYTKACIMEIYGQVLGYIWTFIKGGKFNI